MKSIVTLCPIFLGDCSGTCMEFFEIIVGHVWMRYVQPKVDQLISLVAGPTFLEKKKKSARGEFLGLRSLGNFFFGLLR